VTGFVDFALRHGLLRDPDGAVGAALAARRVTRP
jgi:hypothetical protein